MGFFKSDDHLFAFYEKNTIDRKFTNILRTVKVKSIEFINQYEGVNTNRYGEDNQSLNYDFLINKQEVRFCCDKRIIKSLEDFNDRYNEVVRNKKTKRKGDPDFLGLPDPNNAPDNWFPYTILEVSYWNIVKDLEPTVEYVYFFNLKNSWRKEVESAFNKASDKIIKQAIKSST
ncbi:hypothetical protein N8950_03470 [Candidatus Pelagibacter sp.]|nr:hypothetical protein [Candidatus Pelagibacter sp.]|tara:strand:- start:1064 stop:1585 length:522 start_codon:yes stop_codon:yes gene_type:complete